MRAIVLPEFGSTPELVDIDVPEPADGEVRVRVYAASVNGFDVAVAHSYLNGMMEHRFPVVLGKDFAGVIDAVGPGVEAYAAGDRVFGVITKDFLGDGSFGEYVTVSATGGLARLPDSVDFAEAAAVSLAGTAATDSIDAAGLVPGSVVLISGATGGVGNHAVQLAVAAGAVVIATAHTAEEKAHVTTLGAVETVDYMVDPSAVVLALHPEGVDAVIHLAGDAELLLPALRPGGILVSTVISTPEQLPNATVVPVDAQPSRETLERLAENLTSGASRVTVQRRYALEEAPAALADFAAGTLGKLVIIL